MLISDFDNSEELKKVNKSEIRPYFTIVTKRINGKQFFFFAHFHEATRNKY